MPTFRRVRILPEGRAVQVVEFQGGVKLGSFGTFVVNLGVYSPELTQPPRDVKVEEAHSWNCMAEMQTRLAHLADPCPRGALVSMVTGADQRQQDLWWSYRGGPRSTLRTFQDVLSLFADRGAAWFTTMTAVERFRWAYAVRGARVAGLPSRAPSSDGA